ncbi:MAG: aldo/keto reductase [Candidatus Latescibacteria bacterium]|jgi:aryl-alcohol dehydrogenase-like predicted oxidoreductase|nr:aldo/keto reductase [Candidatus Latescibacterota bacterium]
MHTLSGTPHSRLGLGANPDTGDGFAEVAYAAGVNFFFFYNLSFTGMLDGLERLVRDSRESVILATGTEKRNPSDMRADLDEARSRLGVDVIDLFYAQYISPSDDMEAVLGKDGVIDEIARWRDEGKVRYVGATAHNRPLSVKLIESGRIDVLMHRYNMAHRGSEEQVLPAAIEAGVPVAAFTCTRWGSLLEGHADWGGPVPSAADCYRYVLNHPAVQLAMMSPASPAHLEEDLCVLGDGGGADAEQIARWEAYGELVHGKGDDSYETDWP